MRCDLYHYARYTSQEIFKVGVDDLPADGVELVVEDDAGLW
jgi:hypothetical protein